MSHRPTFVPNIRVAIDGVHTHLDAALTLEAECQPIDMQLSQLHDAVRLLTQTVATIYDRIACINDDVEELR